MLTEIIATLAVCADISNAAACPFTHVLPTIYGAIINDTGPQVIA